MLALDSVTKRFDGVTAVDELSFEIESGRIYGLIGPNGAGKTTALNCVSGLMEVTSGGIWFRDRKISNLPPHRISNLGISRTFQQVKLFESMSVFENLLVSLYNRLPFMWRFLPTGGSLLLQNSERYDIVLEVLKHLKLKEYLHRHPQELPFGVKRRVELARVMVRDTRLILLDEPAAGMNPRETSNLHDALSRIGDQGYTLLVVDHDMKFIMGLCDYIFVMDRGKKIAEGPPKEIQNNPEVVNVYLGE